MRNALIALTIVTFSGQAVAAEPKCGPTADALTMLKKDYNEAVRGLGMSQGGFLLQFLRSPDGATWTALLSTPAGNSCVVAEGRDWQDIAAPAEPEGGPEL